MESNSTQEEQKLEVKERTQNIHPLSSPKKHRNNNTNNNNTNNNNNKSPRKSQNSLNRGKKLKRKDSILYSQDEHEELEKIFNEVDRRGDGFLLKEQLPDVYERIFGSFPTDKQLSQMEENYILIQEKIYLKEFKKGTVHWLLEKEKEEFEAVTGSEDRTLRFQKTEIQILRQVILQLKQKLGQIEMEREGMNEDLQDQATELRNLREDLKKVQKEKEKQIRVLQRNLETVENDLHEYDKGNMPPASPTKYKTFYHDSRKDDENYILHLENTVRDLKKENQLLRITARVNLNRSNNQSFGDQDPEDKDEKIRVLTEKVQELGESLNESKILSEAKERKIKELSQKIDELELLLAQSKQIDTNQSLNDELSFFAMFATNHQMPDIPKTPPPSPHLSPVQSPRTPRASEAPYEAFSLSDEEPPCSPILSVGSIEQDPPRRRASSTVEEAEGTSGRETQFQPDRAEKKPKQRTQKQEIEKETKEIELKEELKKKEDEIEKKTQDFKLREDEIEKRAKEIELKEQEIEKRAQEFKQKEDEIEQKAQDLKLREEQIEKRAKEFKGEAKETFQEFKVIGESQENIVKRDTKIQEFKTKEGQVEELSSTPNQGVSQLTSGNISREKTTPAVFFEGVRSNHTSEEDRQKEIEKKETETLELEAQIRRQEEEIKFLRRELSTMQNHIEKDDLQPQTSSTAAAFPAQPESQGKPSLSTVTHHNHMNTPVELKPSRSYFYKKKRSKDEAFISEESSFKEEDEFNPQQLLEPEKLILTPEQVESLRQGHPLRLLNSADSLDYYLHRLVELQKKYNRLVKYARHLCNQIEALEFQRSLRLVSAETFQSQLSETSKLAENITVLISQSEEASRHQKQKQTNPVSLLSDHHSKPLPPPIIPATVGTVSESTLQPFSLTDQKYWSSVGATFGLSFCTAALYFIRKFTRRGR